MARKSRRNQEKAIAAEKNTALPKGESLMATAAYIRLSVESEKAEERDSLKTQEIMVSQFIQNHTDLELADTYIDNGYSGTNFDRPEFVRLMDDVRNGKIQCIVVKDLSRFGRNYLEMGYYVETLLPSLHVRFIAITDGFDSSREEDRISLKLPIKNMVNAMYAKDISKKQCAATRMRKQRADAMPEGSAPYGYRFSEDRTKFVADEETAPAVRMIFQWLAMGYRAAEIAARLSWLKIVVPGERKTELSQKKTMEHKGKWASYMIRAIAENSVYIGEVAVSKQEQALYRSQPKTKKPKSEWIVRSNAHEPLVAAETREAALENIAQHKLKNTACAKREKNGYAKISSDFSGLVYCAECKQKMYFYCDYHDFDHAKGGVGYFACPKRSGQPICGEQKVYDDYLKIVVMDQIWSLIQTVCNQNRLLQQIKAEKGRDSLLAGIKRKVLRLQNELKKTEDKMTRLYEDYADGLLNAEDYQHLKRVLLNEKESLREKIRTAEQEMRKGEQDLQEYERTALQMEEYLTCKGYNAALVRELVEKIIVSKGGAIEVEFKCNDVYREVALWMEAGDAV